MDQTNDLTGIIIGAAIEVHQQLGPGLLENFYRSALAYELRQRGLKVEEELQLPVSYKGIDLGFHYRRDLMVEDEIVVELKATPVFHPVFKYQLLTYLRLAKKRIGLLINFHNPTLVEGVTRVINNF